MNLCDAVKKAVALGSCITTPEFRGGAKIRPTNDRGNCIVSMWDGSKPSKTGWQPTADDILRDDWEIADGLDPVDIGKYSMNLLDAALKDALTAIYDIIIKKANTLEGIERQRFIVKQIKSVRGNFRCEAESDGLELPNISDWIFEALTKIAQERDDLP